ncbi:MAG TPA: peptide MFS transporter [Planctomycetota bacterium]|nr:peptide MFS transporter [Planctomycetota bacterium]
MNRPAPAPARHPPGLSTLFFTEMWERFSYYGMRAFLVLFMVTPAAAGGLGFSDSRAGMIYGLYTSMVYLLSVPGGWLADRYMGQERAVLIGGVLIMSGHISLALPAVPTFYLGLCLVAVGTGMLKPNISTLVGRLYEKEDGRRDAGFTIFYMGINLGAFAAPLVCGTWLAESEGFREWLKGRGLPPSTVWHFAFGAAAVGMMLGLAQYVLGLNRLGGARLSPPRIPGSPRARAVGLILGAVLLVVAVLVARSGAFNLNAEQVSRTFDILLPLVSVGSLALIFGFGTDSVREKRRMIVISILFGASALFWGCFEQAGSTLTLFAARHTDRRIFGHSFGATAYQSLNSLFVVLLAPVFAALWARLANTGREPSTPTKFGLAMLCVGLGFLVLIPASGIVQRGGLAGPQWLALLYLLHTAGELCLSPVGLSAMTRLAPRRTLSLIMGIWFLATSLGNYMAGRAVGLTQTMPLGRFFFWMTVVPGSIGGLLLLLARPLGYLQAEETGSPIMAEPHAGSDGIGME